MAADQQVQQGRVRDLCAGQDPALDPQRAEERGHRVQEQGHEQDVNLELLEGIKGDTIEMWKVTEKFELIILKETSVKEHNTSKDVNKGREHFQLTFGTHATNEIDLFGAVSTCV